MTEFEILCISIIYFIVLVFGTHFIRTLAFGRHEAITFECSSVAFIISIIFIWEYGINTKTILVFLGLLLMFLINAFAQYHFFDKLQDRIISAVLIRSPYFSNIFKSDKKNKYKKEKQLVRCIIQIGSKAIMPSFSRFIEESLFFNNPGGFIGIVKSLLSRKRFQKKKYLMRECFADNLNLIGPCIPQIDSMIPNVNTNIPKAVHSEDLALDFSDEKKGLFTFDFFGFGALVLSILLVYFFSSDTSLISHFNNADFQSVFYMFISSIVLTFICHKLRKIGFSRYESISYEFSFVALVISSYRVITYFMVKGNLELIQITAASFFVIWFIILSFVNKHFDKSLHKKINLKFDEIIKIIDDNLYKKIEQENGSRTIYDSEIRNTKIRFLENLKILSGWTLVPFPEIKKKSQMSLSFLTAMLIFLIVPEINIKNEQDNIQDSKIDSTVKELAKNFEFSDTKKMIIEIILILFSIFVLGTLFALILRGYI